MSEYKPPCIFGKCEKPGSDTEHNQSLCIGMAKCIIGAGGTGILEGTHCPLDALFVIGPEQSDEQMQQIRSSLGIVGYYEGGESLFD